MKTIFLFMLLCSLSAGALTAPTISATAKGPDQINLTWAAASQPGYGYLVEIQSAGDSRYTSFTPWVPVPNASGDSGDLNTDPTCQYCFQPLSNGFPTWVVEAPYIDPIDGGSAAQAIIYGLIPNVSYSFRVRTYQGYTSPTYSVYSNTATATTSNYTLRYVSTTGSDSHGGTNSTTDAWLTIAHASATATTGQCVIVDAGNYPLDTVNPSNSGSSGVGNHIVFLANPGSTVTITSNPASGFYGFLNLTTSYVIVDGINSTAPPPSGGVNMILISGDHNAVFGGNWDNRNLTGGLINGHHNLIQGAYIHDTGNWTTDAGDNLDIIGESGTLANYNILQYNHITRGSHGNTIVKNVNQTTAPTMNQTMNNILDGGWGNALGNIVQSTSVAPPTLDLNEGNWIAYVWMNPGNTDFKEPIEEYATHNTWRRNISIVGGSHGMEINAYQQSANHNLAYNNIFYKIGARCWWIGAPFSGANYTGNQVSNNICTRGGTVTTAGNILASLQWFYTQESDMTYSFNDTLYYSGNTPEPSQATIYYNAGNAPDPETVTYADTNYSPPFSNNVALDVDPQYVSETGFDFHLRSTSPLIGAATSVTDSTWGTISNTNLGAFDGSVTVSAPIASGNIKFGGNISVN